MYTDRYSKHRTGLKHLWFLLHDESYSCFCRDVSRIFFGSSKKMLFESVNAMTRDAGGSDARTIITGK